MRVHSAHPQRSVDVAGEETAKSSGGRTMGRRVAFQTLGCRLNQYETDSIVTDFRRAGYTIVPFDGDADCYIVNTCTVTDRSDRKSRNLINRTLKRHPRPVVVAAGCYVDAKPSYFDDHTEIDYVIGNDEKFRIFDLVDAHFRRELVGREEAGPATTPETGRRRNELRENRFAFGDGRDGFHTRAHIKIQDGCDNFCTFCIIPFVRGHAVSRSAKDIVEHARRVIDDGAREIVLTGVNMGRYEDTGVTFTALIERLLELPGEYRLRLSSLEPDILGDGFHELVTHHRFCPHLHLCLQSGSDRILLAMRRQYDVAEFLDLVESIRNHDSEFNFTTDILVGFPGESDEEFAETVRIVRRVGFSHIHTFPYSVRAGTRAATLPGHFDEGVKAARAAVVRQESDEMKRIYRSRFTGRTDRLLVERSDADGLAGYGSYYVPILVPHERDDGARDRGESARNRFVDVVVTGLADGDDPTLIARFSQFRTGG